MNEKKIRVLVVDDSALVRRTIQDILQKDPEIEVIGYAKDGIETLKKAKELNPDVITLDVEMPLMDGLTCLENLQKQGNYGIIVISSFNPERANTAIRALELGAFDIIYKTGNIFDSSSADKQSEIITKVKLAYRTLVKAEPLRPLEKKQPSGSPEEDARASELKYIIAIGISTGGPRALSAILPELPADLPAAIVIVQHMPPGFTKSLAMRLDEISCLKVKEAENNEELKAGTVYIAPGDYHLTFTSQGKKAVIQLTQTTPVGGFRPSADVMMSSLASIKDYSVIGVIMTGMGSDGSKGLKELKENKNAFIIAQDESTSIVFGMPRSAIDLGIVDKIVPLQDIPACIMNFMGVRQ